MTNYEKGWKSKENVGKRMNKYGKSMNIHGKVMKTHEIMQKVWKSEEGVGGGRWASMGK